MGANDPDAAPLRVDLGAGVSALIPLALYAVVPADRTKRQARPKETPNVGYSANDRYVRLAAVAELSMVMQHFYPYFDWRGMSRGVFPVLFAWVENQLVITHVSDTTETAARRGDVVVSINDVPAKQQLEAMEAVASAATPQWARYRSTSDLGLGAMGAVMQLRVRSGGGANAPIRSVQLKAAPLASTEEIPAEVRPAKIADLRPGVLYVDMGRISDDDFTNALPRLRAAKHVVFDLRGYPSFNTLKLFPMLSDSLIMSAHFETPLTTMPDQQRVTYREGRWRLPPTKPRITAKTYFLTDGRAISYAESTMGIVEAYKLGEIIGTPTAGTNGNINPFVLPGDYTVYWTGVRVTKHDGSAHHGVGILPTIRAEPTIRGVFEGRDEVLEKALDLISTRK